MIAQAMYGQDFEKLSGEEKMEIRLKQLKDAVDDRAEELSQKNKELHQKDEEILQLKKELASFKNDL